MNWEPVKKLVAEMGGRRVPETVVFGKEALIARVGKEVVVEAEAWAKFGSQRRQRRAAWDGYIYEADGAWVYASPHPSDVRNAGFESWPLVEAVIRWALGAHSPSVPAHTAFAVGRVPTGTPPVLALDTEGIGCIDRVSLAGETDGLTWAATLPWDGPARELTAGLLSAVEHVVIYNAVHDVPLLESYGLEVDRSKVIDLMMVHQMLNPWREKGLGKAAPLYVPVAPWKGCEDGEWYSLMDAWVLIPMWTEMQAQLGERRMTDLFDREMRHYWRVGGFVRPSWHGVENTVTKAAGLQCGIIR